MGPIKLCIALVRSVITLPEEGNKQVVKRSFWHHMMPGQVSDFWGFEPPILAVVPATLPLSYALKQTQTEILTRIYIFFGVEGARRKVNKKQTFNSIYKSKQTIPNGWNRSKLNKVGNESYKLNSQVIKWNGILFFQIELRVPKFGGGRSGRLGQCPKFSRFLIFPYPKLMKYV